MEMLIKENNIKYLIDFHGLSAKRGYDINFGVHLGKNINNNQKSFDRLCKSLEKEKFIMSIDKPFMAGSNTIAGAMRNKFENIFTLQIEINCAITNKIENAKIYEKLLNILLKWIESLC